MCGGKQAELPTEPAAVPVVGVPMEEAPVVAVPVESAPQPPVMPRSSPSLAALERKFTRDGRKWTMHGPQTVGGGVIMLLMGVMLLVPSAIVSNLAGGITGAVFAVIGVAWLSYNLLTARTFTFDDGTATLTMTYRRCTCASPELIPYSSINDLQVDRIKSGTYVCGRRVGYCMKYTLSFSDRPDIRIAEGNDDGEDWVGFVAARKSSML